MIRLTRKYHTRVRHCKDVSTIDTLFELSCAKNWSGGLGDVYSTMVEHEGNYMRQWCLKFCKVIFGKKSAPSWLLRCAQILCHFVQSPRSENLICGEHLITSLSLAFLTKSEILEREICQFITSSKKINSSHWVLSIQVKWQSLPLIWKLSPLPNFERANLRKLSFDQVFLHFFRRHAADETFTISLPRWCLPTIRLESTKSQENQWSVNERGHRQKFIHQ